MERGDIYEEAGVPRQVHSLSSQILWHPHRRNLLQQGACLNPIFPPSPWLPSRANSIPRWLLPGSIHKPSQTGLDEEARPLPALAVQGWPFPSDSIIPSFPNGTCPNTFALNRAAVRNLRLPTHVKGTAGGEEQGKQPRLQRGGKGEPSAEPRAGGCGRGAGCWSRVCPDIPSQLRSKGVPPQLTLGFSSQN